MSHLSGECCSKVFLKQFGEDKKVNGDDNNCCDVCSNQHSISRTDRKEELSIAIDTIGTKGELKIAQWIRGSTLQWTSITTKQHYLVAIQWCTLNCGGRDFSGNLLQVEH